LLWSASYPCLVQAQSVPPGCDTRLPHALLGPKSGFPRLSSLSAGSLATSRFPWLFVSFLHLLPDSLRPCESGRVLGLHATPVRFWLKQRPLVVIPGFCILAATRFRGCFVFVRGGVPCGGLSSRSGTSFHLADPGRFCRLHDTTLLSLGRCRPTARSVSALPLFLAVKQNPLVAHFAPGIPLQHLIAESFA